MYNRSCYYHHPDGIETSLEWIDLHPTDYLITMMKNWPVQTEPERPRHSTETQGIGREDRL